VRAKKLATNAAVLERGQRRRPDLTATGRLRIKIARETSVRCRWTRSPGRHEQSNRERGWELGAGSGRGRRTAGPGRTAQKQRREVQRSRRRRRKQPLTTGTASGRRGQVPMSAQVSPQSRFSTAQRSVVQCSAREQLEANGRGQRAASRGNNAVRCRRGQRSSVCGGNGRTARGGEGARW
jgi:hypothetical protein